jgi:hypothetical protein
MKLRPLPAIDLANIAPKPRELKYSSLMPFSGGGGSWSYDPARAQTFNVFNPEDPMGLGTKPPTLAQIIANVKRDCHQEEQRIGCVQVTKMLWAWVRENITQAVEVRLPSTNIGPLGTVRYWSNLVAMHNGRPTIFCFDHRRQNGLSRLGRRFIWSMMNERVRKVYPDLADVQMAIVRFPQPTGADRKIRVDLHSDELLFTADELEAMLQETADIFGQVLADKAAEARISKRRAG